MTHEYMSGEERAAREDAELAAAEQAFETEFGTPAAPAQDTPIEQPQEPAQEPVTDWEKRYRDLQSHHDKTTNDLRTQLKELQGGEPTTEEEVANLRAEIDSLRGKEEARELEAYVQTAQAAVGQAHPDFVNVINSPEFSEWIKGQPQVYQDAIYADRPDATLAIDALTLYKVQSGFASRQQADAQKQVMDQAAMSINAGHREAPQANTEKVWTWTEIQQLSAREYAQLESEIDKAIADGRVR